VLDKIPFVANRVFPVAPGPQPVAGPAIARQGHAPRAQCVGEMGLDRPPPSWVIRVALGQRPYGMEMVGQHDRGNDRKRPLPAHGLNRLPENLDMIRQRLNADPLG
jgi:hypothetical protein